MNPDPLDVLLEAEKGILAKLDPAYPQKDFPLLCHPAVPYIMSLGVLAHQRKFGINTSFYLRIVELTKKPLSEMLKRAEDSSGVSIPEEVVNKYLLGLAARILDVSKQGVEFRNVTSHTLVGVNNSVADIKNYFHDAMGNPRGIV